MASKIATNSTAFSRRHLYQSDPHHQSTVTRQGAQVDPVRTMASGKVEIGAFRTYPEGYRCEERGVEREGGG